MIQMPRRSVTRFFIPLIDVLILLFCIFLLMEFNSESEVDRQTELVEDQSADISKLQAMLRDRIKELQGFEDDRPKLQEIAKLRKELDDLKKASQKDLAQQIYLRLITVGPKGESISYLDPKRPKDPIFIDSHKKARELFKADEKEAKGRPVYYIFVNVGLPLYDKNVEKYETWYSRFATNSLVKIKVKEE